MDDTLNPEARWPDLFAQLEPEQRESVAFALVANYHEGWTPNREDVAALIDHARGAVDMDEYRRRAIERAQARAAR